jgi:hypothetical protein
VTAAAAAPRFPIRRGGAFGGMGEAIWNLEGAARPATPRF